MSDCAKCQDQLPRRCRPRHKIHLHIARELGLDQRLTRRAREHRTRFAAAGKPLRHDGAALDAHRIEQWQETAPGDHIAFAETEILRLWSAQLDADLIVLCGLIAEAEDRLQKNVDASRGNRLPHRDHLRIDW